MVRLFLTGNSSVLLILPFLVLGYDFLYIYSGHQLSLVSHTAWGDVYFAKWVSMIVANVIILINSFFLNRIFNFHSFHEKNTYIPALIYIVSCSFFNFFYTFQIDVLNHFIFLIIIDQFLKIPFRDDRRALYFNAFFLFGICLTFSPENIILLPLIFLLLVRFTILNSKDVLLILVAVLIPIIYYFSFQFLWYDNIGFEWRNILLFQYNMDILKPLIISLGLFIYSYWSFRDKLNTAGLVLSKKLQLIVSFFILLSIQSFFYSKWDFLSEKVSYLLVTLSFLLTYAFTRNSFSLLSTSSFYIIVLFSLLKFFIV